MARSRFTDETGFSLVEVMIASLLLCVGLVSLAQLFAISTRSNRGRALEHIHRDPGAAEDGAAPRPDLGLRHRRPAVSATRPRTSPPSARRPAVGAVRRERHAGSRRRRRARWAPNTDGWVDYLDPNGCVLSGGGIAAAGHDVHPALVGRAAAHEPEQHADPAGAGHPQRANRGDADAGNVARLPEEARLMSVKTRKIEMTAPTRDRALASRLHAGRDDGLDGGDDGRHRERCSRC